MGRGLPTVLNDSVSERDRLGRPRARRSRSAMSAAWDLRGPLQLDSVCPPHHRREPMGATRTPGITIGADGRSFIDKRHRGIRIGVRVGATNQKQAEQRLRTEMQQVDIDLAGRAYTR